VKALVIAPQPFFSPRGTPFSVYYRTLVLSEMGVEIDLLTYGAGQDVDLPNTRILRIPRFRFVEPIKVGPSRGKAFLDLFIAARAVGLLLRHRYDFVHAHEESVFLCWLLRPLLGFKLVYDMHSSLPQQLTNFRFTRSRLLIGLFEKLEDACLTRSEAVITICPALARYAEPRMPDPGRHLLIENSIFDPVRLRNAAPDDNAASEWEERLPDGRPIVAYAGTFEPYQGLDVLLAAFADARRREPAAFLLMIGGSPSQVAERREQARELGIDEHVLFTGSLPQPLTRRLLGRADVLTSPRVEGSNTPLKIYEQLASGKPIVATRIVAHTQVLSEDVCFLAAPRAAEIGRSLYEALTDSERVARTVRAARELYEREYSRPAYEKKMRALLELLR
jgi:glycosyltransferase involved in cell wall biosynthesis